MKTCENYKGVFQYVEGSMYRAHLLVSNIQGSSLATISTHVCHLPPSAKQELALEREAATTEGAATKMGSPSNSRRAAEEEEQAAMVTPVLPVINSPPTRRLLK